MSSEVPIIRQVSWVAAIPQFVVSAIAVVVAIWFSPGDGLLIGAAVYLIYSVASRQIITRHHRAGVGLLKQQQFEQAIARFQKSLEFLDRNSWIDRYRSVVLMSASATSFREMALANIGFAYSQLGRGDEARAAYERCLQRFPDSGLAKSALRMMNSVQSTAN